MKKIKLIAAAMLSSALVLSGCGHDHTYSDDWSSDANKHWHAATCEHTDLRKDEADHIDEDQNGKCDVCEHSVPVDPAIKSIKISGSKSSMDLGTQVTLTATVSAVGGAATGVKWSVNNANATLSADSGKTVKLTAVNEGTVVVTATSAYDETKTASVTINIIDRGFDPEWIEEGFTYSKTFPVEQIKSFLGSGEYDVIAPSEMLAGGAYYCELEADEEGPACLVVVIDGTLDESYFDDLVDAEFERVYQTSFGTFEAVDPTGKYTVSFYCEMDEETYEYLAPTYFQFYKSEDVWDSPNKTSDTAWNLERIVNDDSSEIAIASEWVEKVPFVALGEDYSIEYIVDDSEYYYYIDMLMMFGFTEEEAIEYLLEEGYTKEALTYYYLSVYDYSICEPFEGYDEVLLNAGFAHIEGEDEDGEYDYYELTDGLIAYDLSFSFTEAGNTIYLEQGVATLQAFPVNEANDFIENVLGSENRVVAYEETEGASFQAVIGEDEMDIVVDYVDLSEAQAYADKLAGLGFEVEYTPASDEFYPSWVATKGKLVVEFYLKQFKDEDTKSYLDEGPLYFFIYADNTKHEVQGIYLPEKMSALVMDGEFTLDLEVVKLDDPTLNVVSTNPEVATVDGLKVTPVGEGQTTITVTIPETEFSASTVLTVINKSRFDLAMEECNEWLAFCGVEEPLELPLPTGGKVNSEEDYYYDEDYECYSIVVSGGCDDVAYLAQLEDAGFEIGVDQYGEFAYLGDVIVSPWMYGSDLEIDIYYAPATEGGQVFDVDDLYDGAEICITCLDADAGVGAYNGSKNFGSVELGDTLDNCTVFVLRDNGDGTWGLFDEDGNQYGADGNKNIKISGSGVDYDWTIEIDDEGNATLSCNGWIFMYNSQADLFKTYAEGMQSGVPVQIFLVG